MALTASSPVVAESHPVSEADRAIAAEWAAKVDGDLESRDPGEAARLLLRAVRWDPSRWDDYRAAIELLEAVDPEAAARHAVAELRGQARFNRADAALLSRLAKAADASADDATWQDAAELTRAAAERMAKFGPSQALKTAQLWTDAGSAYASRGDLPAASHAYDQMQRIAAATQNDRLKQAYRWDLIAGFHLDAEQPARAAFAIEMLQEREGETPRALVLQSRLALQLDEPLAAVDYAEQAINKLEGPADDAAASAYAAFIEAMHTVNQSDRAAERLGKDSDAATDNVSLAIATIDALMNAGRNEQAWRECGTLLDELTAAISKADGLEASNTSAELLLQSQFADAATRRLRLATRLGRVGEALDESVGWTERIGDLDFVWDELATLGREDDFRSAASEWLDDRDADSDAPDTQSSAAATIAHHVGRLDDVVAYVLAMADQQLEQNVHADAVARECATWANTLLASRHNAAARELLEGAIDRLADEQDSSAIAELRVRLARALINEHESGGRIDPAITQESLRLLSAARSQSPDDGFVAYYALFDSLYMDRIVDAAAIGEAIFERWPAPDEDTLFGSHRYYEASELFAAALLERDDPGDAERAAKLLEASLDHWPRSTMAMTYLAWHDSRSSERLERALRLAREATRIRPAATDSRGFLGVVLLRAGQTEKGIESLRQALAHAEEEKLSLWERTLFRQELAEALRSSGRAEEAEIVESAVPANQ